MQGIQGQLSAEEVPSSSYPMTTNLKTLWSSRGLFLQEVRLKVEESIIT
jgi:hypothetical protein